MVLYGTCYMALVHIYLGKNIILFVALFIFAGLFIIVKTWKQSQPPLTDGWIKMCYIYMYIHIIYIYVCVHTYICIHTHRYIHIK